MKRLALFGLIVVLIGFICMGSASLFLDGYYLPFKPCRPITFPDGITVVDDTVSEAADNLSVVLRFYELKLGTSLAHQAQSNDWKETKIDDKNYLFDCYGTDINGLTTETGCVFVTAKGETTVIRTRLRRSEGGNVPCK